MALRARKGYFDWITLALVTALVLVGFVLQINATGRPTAQEGASLAEKLATADWEYPRLHLLWYGLGCLLGAIAIALPYHLYGRLKELIYWVNVALLAAVLVVGKVTGGAQSWFAILENRSFQPSEIAKLALIITLARQLADMPRGAELPATLPGALPGGRAPGAHLRPARLRHRHGLRGDHRRHALRCGHRLEVHDRAECGGYCGLCSHVDVPHLG